MQLAARRSVTVDDSRGEQVLAVQAGPKARDLAALEISRQQQQRILDPTVPTPDATSTTWVLNEEVFVAQLHQTAVLVNQDFQVIRA